MSGKRKRNCEDQNRKKDRATFDVKRRKIQTNDVRKLTDICAKYVAEKFPYQHVEDSLPHIPEPIQERIVFWAFPKSEGEIALYSSTNHQNSPIANNKQPFQIGLKLLESGFVSDVLQIGFHLSGRVKEVHGICLQRKVCQYKVSIKFDRCKITSVSCTCSNKTILWCPHAVALAIYRIRFAERVRIRLPVSETILQLKTQQLQSLLLHLITKHDHDLLPSVQNLLDDLKRPESEISNAAGVPDPTAGACSGSESVWYFDDDLIRDEVRSGLEPNNTGKNISSLFNKVREMFSVADSNAIRLLSLITETFIETLQPTPGLEPKSITEKSRKLWDSLSAVWVVAVLNPYLLSEDKEGIREKLSLWNDSLQNCQFTDGDETEHAGVINVFQLSLQALAWKVESAEADLIQAAAFVDAFRCHGLQDQAVNIAIKVAEKLQLTNIAISKANDVGESEVGGSWLGHSLDPINILFDVLCNEADISGNKAIYLPLAVAISFAGLGQMRPLPSGKYEQLRMCHREEQLIAQLEELDFTKSYLKTYICQFCLALRTREITNYGVSPSHSFARFLFNKVVNIDRNLAYTFSIPLLPLTPNISEEPRVEMEADHVCHIMSHLESQQSELASTLLRGCCDASDHQAGVVCAIEQSVKNATQLFRLAKLANTSIEENSIGEEGKSKLLQAAITLATKAVKLTLNAATWNRHEMIRWLVSSTVLLGKAAVLSLVLSWVDLFTPEEMSKDVAPMLTSQPILFELRMAKEEEKSFFSTLRNIVIESAIRDPSSCALFALTLCEGDAESFDLACQIVNESASRLGTGQLFSIARYLDSKGHTRKALKAATLAIKQLDIGLEQETHPAISDVFWVCALASSLGRDELTQITPIVCNCIRNPVVLTEIARRSVRTTNVITNGTHTKGKTKFSYDKEPLSRLLATAQQLFIQEVQHKLENISPKFYKDFIKYLKKVRTCFQLVDEGQEQFRWLLDFIATSQKGRKKLQSLIRDSLVV